MVSDVWQRPMTKGPGFLPLPLPFGWFALTLCTVMKRSSLFLFVPELYMNPMTRLIKFCGLLTSTWADALGAGSGAGSLTGVPVVLVVALAVLVAVDALAVLV